MLTPSFWPLQAKPSWLWGNPRVPRKFLWLCRAVFRLATPALQKGLSCASSRSAQPLERTGRPSALSLCSRTGLPFAFHRGGPQPVKVPFVRAFCLSTPSDLRPSQEADLPLPMIPSIPLPEDTAKQPELSSFFLRQAARDGLSKVQTYDNYVHRGFNNLQSLQSSQEGAGGLYLPVVGRSGNALP